MMLVAGLLTAYTLVALAYWLLMLYGVVRLRRDVRRLDRLDPPALGRWPRLSVIVPACDEADEIEPAARTLLNEDYPDLELIFVDDRSTDSTGEIIDRLAAEDPRIKVIHVAELPEGWLGKVNALNRGLAESTGEFVLLTDADVHFTRGALRKAVAHCEAERLDHLAALPTLWRTSVLVGSVLGSFLRQFLVATRPWAVRDARSRAYIGIGAFNLVRRSAFEATPGFEWLRLETADDMGVGMMMKRSGARCDIVAAFGLLGLHWYRTFRDAARGAEKGYASAAGCSLVQVVIRALIGLALETAPILAPAAAVLCGSWVIGGGAAAIVAAFLASSVLLAWWAGARILPLPVLLGPLAAVVSAAAFLRCGWVGWRRGGVVWRGTLYPAEQLREGRRIRIP
jgi:hypothetical protein